MDSQKFLNNKIPKTISRKKFLQFLANANAVFVSSYLFKTELFARNKDFFNDQSTSLDEKMKFNVAMARALAHKPPEKYSTAFPNSSEFEIRRSAALNLLVNKAYLASDFSFPSGAFSDLVLNVDPEPLYKSLTSDTVQVDVVKGLDNLDKDSVSIIGTSISGVAGLAGAVFPGLVIPMAMVGAVGSGVSIKSSLMEDKSSRQIVGDSSLFIAKSLWDNPKAKKIMTAEVKGVLREAFGVDFGASVEENKAGLSKEMQGYVDVYLNSKGLNPEQLQEREEATIKIIITNVNKSLDAAVGKIIDDMKAQQQDAQKRQIEKQYYDGEIRGGVYLVGVLADHFMSPQGARIVNVLANSAVQMDMMITALSMGALGPVGMAAGCVLIALNLLGVFGSKGPSADQLIMEAVGKVQESIFALHKEMRELFGIVIENQQKMMQRIDAQFELLKTKQDQALQQLDEIRNDLKLVIDESRVRGRNVQTAELYRKVQSLNTEINKKMNNSDKIDKGKIEGLIEECHLHAIKITKFDDFTGLPNPDEPTLQWDAGKILTFFRTGDQVDHLVGIIPLIIKRFAPEQTITVINNPRGLARATMAISIAYVIFPEVAITFEKNSLHYLQDFKTLLSNTKASLIRSTDIKTIASFKSAYLDVVERMLDESINIGERATKTNNQIKEDAKIRVLAISPDNSLSSSFNDINPTESNYFPNNTILESYKFEINPSTGGLPIIGSYRSILWKGIEDHEVNADDFLEFLKNLNIIQIDSGEEFKHIFFMGSEEVKIKDIDWPYGKVFVAHQFQETSSASKITIHHANGDISVIGDGIRSGWIKSKLSDKDSTEKHISYISNDSSDNSVVGGSSWNFLNKLMDEVNLVVKLKKEFIENTTKVITDFGNRLTLEFEAASMCLKYLAGINIYLKTGDVELGTAVAMDKVAGVNSYLKQTSDGALSKQTESSSLFSNRQDIEQLIFKITNNAYLENLSALDRKNTLLKDYIKAEVMSTVKARFDEYGTAFFSNNAERFNLPELTISQTMLASAEKSIKKQKKV